MKTAIRWFLTGVYAVCWAFFMPMLVVFTFLIAIGLWCYPDEDRSIFTIWKDIMKDEWINNPRDMWKE